MDAQILREIMGSNLPSGEYTKYFPAYMKMLNMVGAKTINQCAMIAGQIRLESGGLKHRSEIWGPTAQQRTYDGRMGNRVGTSDWSDFRGHGWIQITGRNNHTECSRWAYSKGIVPTVDYFVRNPAALGSDEYCWVGPAWYLTQARPGWMAAADRGDVRACTQMINGGYNHLAERTQFFNFAKSYGARLLPSSSTVTQSPPSKPKVVHPMGEENGVWSVSSGYGSRWGAFHAGLDFAAPLGTPIYAVADATVVQGKERPAGSVSGFGNWVWLDAQNTLGRDFIYGHMRHHEIYVKRGDRVKAGDLIARVGSEGGSTGPHLHFEVWGSPGRIGGRHEDPAPWLKKNINTGEELTVAQIDELKELIKSEAEKTRAHTEAWFKAFNGPIGADVKDIRQQVTGARDSIAGDLAASYPGWDVDALVNAAEDKIRAGQGLTTTEMLALAAYEVLTNSAIKDGK